MTPKAQPTKEKREKFGFLKIKNLGASKDTIKKKKKRKRKGNTQKGENIHKSST